MLDFIFVLDLVHVRTTETGRSDAQPKISREFFYVYFIVPKGKDQKWLNDPVVAIQAYTQSKIRMCIC